MNENPKSLEPIKISMTFLSCSKHGEKVLATCYACEQDNKEEWKSLLRSKMPKKQNSKRTSPVRASWIDRKSAGYNQALDDFNKMINSL